MLQMNRYVLYFSPGMVSFPLLRQFNWSDSVAVAAKRLLLAGAFIGKAQR